MGHSAKVLMCYEKLLKFFHKKSQNTADQSQYNPMSSPPCVEEPVYRSISAHCSSSSSASTSSSASSTANAVKIKSRGDHSPTKKHAHSAVPYYTSLCKCGVKLQSGSSSCVPRKHHSNKRVLVVSDQVRLTANKKYCTAQLCPKRCASVNSGSEIVANHRLTSPIPNKYTACNQYCHRECQLACAAEARRAGVCSDLRRGLPHSVRRHPDDGYSSPASSSTPPSSAVLAPPNYNPFLPGTSPPQSDVHPGAVQ